MTPIHAAAFTGLAPLGALLAGVLAWLTPYLVRAVLVGLGIGLVSYVGIDAGMSALEGYVRGTLTGLPANMLSIVALTRLDDAATVVMSAISGRIALNLTTGAVSKVTFGRRSA